MSQHIPLPTEL